MGKPDQKVDGKLSAPISIVHLRGKQTKYRRVNREICNNLHDSHVLTAYPNRMRSVIRSATPKTQEQIKKDES